MSDEIDGMLPGLAPATPPPGVLESRVSEQVSKLRDLGYIEDHHAGLVELALVTARDIDRSFGKGAPSGRANLLRVMNEILEKLPQPQAEIRDKLDDAIDALRSDGSDDDAAMAAMLQEAERARSAS